MSAYEYFGSILHVFYIIIVYRSSIFYPSTQLGGLWSTLRLLGLYQILLLISIKKSLVWVLSKVLMWC